MPSRQDNRWDRLPEPVIEEAKIIEEGRAIGVLLREKDGSISAIRISVEQLAD